MTGTLSRSTTSALLPILRRIWASASADPMASPSGRACDVTRKRRRCLISCKTCSISSIVPLLFLAFLEPAQNVIDSGAVFLRPIEDEVELRHVAHAQANQQFAPDVPLGRVDGRYRLLRFTIIARNLDVYARALAVGREHNLANVAQRNARVTQFPFNDHADLFLQRLTHPLPMVLFAPLLRHGFYIPAKNL